jgi:hypothetical protein
MGWMIFIFIYQLFLIIIGVFKPLTGLSFLMFPPLIASLVFLKKDFNKTAFYIIMFAAIYLILILLGQAYGN